MFLCYNRGPFFCWDFCTPWLNVRILEVNPSGVGFFDASKDRTFCIALERCLKKCSRLSRLSLKLPVEMYRWLTQDAELRNCVSSILIERLNSDLGIDAKKSTARVGYATRGPYRPCIFHESIRPAVWLWEAKEGDVLNTKGVRLDKMFSEVCRGPQGWT